MPLLPVCQLSVLIFSDCFVCEGNSVWRGLHRNRQLGGALCRQCGGPGPLQPVPEAVPGEGGQGKGPPVHLES